VVVAALVGVNLTQHLLASPWWLGPLEAVALLGFARLAGLTWAQLGLARDRLASGCRWALAAIAVVTAVYLVGVLLPMTRLAFRDTRYHLPLPEALMKALVIITLGTVVLEEIAFRSVLWGMLARHLRPWQVLATTSVLFGLWHILPALHVGANQAVASAGGGRTALLVAGTVALTTIGGLVFGELRRRSGSVLASAGAHWATNGLGVLFGVVAWRLAG
jgi:membrane protease YdiL (CAAX protease family)